MADLEHANELRAEVIDDAKRWLGAALRDADDFIALRRVARDVLVRLEQAPVYPKCARCREPIPLFKVLCNGCALLIAAELARHRGEDQWTRTPAVADVSSIVDPPREDDVGDGRADDTDPGGVSS